MNTWTQVNRQLIAKSIGELSYEQVLYPSVKEEDLYSLKLDSGVEYFFRAWKSIWDYLRVDPLTLVRKSHDGRTLSAGQFFIDAKAELAMDEIEFGSFLEEMSSTLYIDSKLFEKNSKVSLEQLADMKSIQRQSYYNGHPKILLNKGRMGWGSEELDQYAPEISQEVCFDWIAVYSTQVVVGVEQGKEYNDFVEQSLTSFELKKFHQKIKALGKAPRDYYLMPVHPWQYSRYIKLQFQEEIHNQKIIYLGQAGDPYRPQVSIRSFSNTERPQKCDIKLSLSIQNTSAVRGLPSQYLKVAPSTSRKLEELCEQDPVLKKRGTQVLKEPAGISYVHPQYKQLKEVPYRFQEYLGVVFRESLSSKLHPDENAIMTGGLFHQDSEKKCLLAVFQRRSGLSMEEWLQRYFESVVIPLYHLQLEYGVGLVAHGQNTILRLKDNIPSGVILKDFQGDLRFSEELKEKSHVFKDVIDSYETLKPEYIIHDLVTGHFVTVLRFISSALFESEGFAEDKFYQILSEVIKGYLGEQKGESVDQTHNLLNEKIKRVLLNKVRFSIGYGDSAMRPKPMLGSDLNNPLYKGAQSVRL